MKSHGNHRRRRQDIDSVNALTVDVEEYYQVEGFADVVSRDSWGQWESRIERSTDRILALLADRGVCGTFFILGCVAECHPELARRIAAAGHEIACHGYDHRIISEQSRAEFRADIRRAKRLLEDQTGEEIAGFRAPTYSITRANLWAVEVLIEEGFRYDSSIFPIYHDRYGIPDAQRFPYVIRSQGGELVEFPPSTVRLGGVNIPMAGGGYFRFLPYPIFRWGLRRINRVEDQPGIFMIHAWETDPRQPVIPGTRMNLWRHRRNLHRTMPRLQRLLGDFRFAPVREVLRVREAAMPVLEPHWLNSGPLYAPLD